MRLIRICPDRAFPAYPPQNKMPAHSPYKKISLFNHPAAKQRQALLAPKGKTSTLPRNFPLLHLKHLANKHALRVFAPTGLFPRIHRKIKCPSSPLIRTAPNHPSNKHALRVFAPTGLFPHIRHASTSLALSNHHFTRHFTQARRSPPRRAKLIPTIRHPRPHFRHRAPHQH